MENATIQELSRSVLTELQRLGYASGTIAFYRKTYQKFISYAEANGIQRYSIEVGERWLKESFGIDPGLVINNRGAYNPKWYYLIRPCQCLTEWQLHGCIPLKKQGKLASRVTPHQFKDGYESYASFCRDADYSERGTYTRLNRIKRMLLFFDQKGVSSFNDITESLAK